MRFLGLLVAVALCLPMPAAAETKMRCSVTEKYYCKPGSGCVLKTPPIDAWSNYYPDSSSYERCDLKGCDRYQAEVHRSGGFLNVEIRGKGALAKIADSGAFSELVTNGMVTSLSYGECRLAPAG